MAGKKMAASNTCKNLRPRSVHLHRQQGLLNRSKYNVIPIYEELDHRIIHLTPSAKPAPVRNAADATLVDTELGLLVMRGDWNLYVCP